jgi:hypothetical protein
MNSKALKLFQDVNSKVLRNAGTTDGYSPDILERLSNILGMRTLE